MATFVLVHGAWHGSWYRKGGRKILQAQGRDVFTPALSGVGARSHLLSPQVNLETRVADVVNLIRLRGAAREKRDQPFNIAFFDRFRPPEGSLGADAFLGFVRQTTNARAVGDF